MTNAAHSGLSKVLATGWAIVCIGCASASATDAVRGTATYRERMALPPDAVLVVVLEDVSRADAPATELASVRVEDPGSPPFAFEIPYDPARIDPRHAYAVRANIRVNGELMFTTDAFYPVLTRGAGREVELLLRRTGGTSSAAGGASGLDLPASFEGELPCADCPGIFYHLDLLPDRLFFLRTTYLGRGAGAISDAVGSWELTPDGERIALFGEGEAPTVFRVVDLATLRMLDAEGRDIDSSLNYDLRRKDGVAVIEPRLAVRGMYRYMADAALFEECLSGRSFQVAQEADNLALERAYLEARREPGEALLVSIQGRLVRRPPMEGDGLVLTVVPERFLGVWTEETCGARGSFSELENNYWKLTRLGDQPVVVGNGLREPHLVFRSGDGSVTGTGGCNRFSGGYEIEGASIRFGLMATTMMACPDGDDVDDDLLAALEAATSFRKTAHHLELFDGDGTMVARFEARELR